MSIKKICDKCGLEIKKDLDNEIAFTKIRRTRYGIDEWINLCDSCLEEFWDWLECKKSKEMKKK